MTPAAPGPAPADERLDVVLGYYLLAVEAGQPAAQLQADLIRRYPELADDLAAFFADQASFQHAIEPGDEPPPPADRNGAKPQPATIAYRAGETEEAPAAESPAPDAPARFGDYELLEEIAQGGMGVVWKARQVSVNRVVALKMILAGRLAGAAAVKRFRAEAEAAAKLDHPNIVPIYEVGEEEGQHYYTMPLIEGGSLAKQADRFPDDPRAAARLMVPIARAVHYAHQRRILHRDLKPGNILLDPAGQPHITDFGLAKQLGGDSDAPAQTATGDIVGTPSYMAPEQAKGVRPLTTAVDVYALGAIFYDLLTGRPPFRADTHLETIRQVVEQEPVRPRLLNPLVDRDLNTICLKCLAKEPDKRFASADALANDIDRWLGGRPIRARPIGPGERFVKWAKRNSGWASLAAVALIILVSGVIAVFVEWRQAERARGDLEVNDYYNRIALAEREQTAGNPRRARQLLADCPPKLRDWEWRYLAGRLDAPPDPPPSSLHDRLYCLTFSPDGQRLAGALRDGRVQLWRRDGQPESDPIWPHDHHEATSVVFSPDGRTLLTAGGDARICFCDAADRTVRRVLTGHDGLIMGLAVSPDGRWVASASKDRTVRLWSAEDGSERWRRDDHGNWVHAVAFSPDGSRVASAGHDGTVRVWSAADGAEALVLRGHTDAARCVRYSPDGRRIASGSYDGTVRLWSADKGRTLAELGGHIGPVCHLEFTPDGARLASASLDGTVKVWDVGRGREALTLHGHDSGVWSVAFSPDGRLLVSGDGGGALRRWDAAPPTRPEPPQPLRKLEGHTGPVFKVAFRPGGRELATASGDGSVRFWDPDTGGELRRLDDVLNQAGSLAYSHDGRRLAVTRRLDFTVVVYEADRLTPEVTLRGHTQEVSSVMFSPDDRRLATTSQDGTVRVWDAATGVEQRRFPGHTGYFQSEAFSPDNRHVAAGSGERLARIWDVETGESKDLSGHREPVVGVAYSADGRLLATSSWDRTVRVWDTTTPKELHVLHGHDSLVYRLSFGPGDLLASAGWDGTVRLWSAATGRPRGVLTGHTAPVYSVAFSPDGRRMASAGGRLGSGEVFLWAVPGE
jgi:WD40 repeat protein/tRNA A-37 threonylcarbamoyl transferase component Bud32